MILHEDTDWVAAFNCTPMQGIFSVKYKYTTHTKIYGIFGLRERFLNESEMLFQVNLIWPFRNFLTLFSFSAFLPQRAEWQPFSLLFLFLFILFIFFHFQGFLVLCLSMTLPVPWYLHCNPPMQLRDAPSRVATALWKLPLWRKPHHGHSINN